MRAAPGRYRGQHLLRSQQKPNLMAPPSYSSSGSPSSQIPVHLDFPAFVTCPVGTIRWIARARKRHCAHTPQSVSLPGSRGFQVSRHRSRPRGQGHLLLLGLPATRTPTRQACGRTGLRRGPDESSRVVLTHHELALWPTGAGPLQTLMIHPLRYISTATIPIAPA